jgi:hypothetical protein
VTGNVNATTGNIGGFNITANAITGSGFFLSGSATGDGFFISSSRFNVKASGDVTASSALFSGSVSITGNVNATTGNIGGFNITANAITGSAFFLSGSAANNGTAFFISSSRFNVKGNGDITGSNVLFTGGRIAGFTISDSTLSNSTNFFISGSATGDGFFISSSRFNVKANGNVTGSQVLFTGGKIGGFDITSTQISDTLGDLVLKSNGQITGSNVLFDGGKIGGFTIGTTTLTAGGSALSLRSDGEITGSVLRLRRTIGGTEYTFLDTVQGSAAFTNIGRQVVGDKTEWTRAGGDDGTAEMLVPDAEWYFNILPNETKLVITYQHLAHVDGSTNTKGTSRIRWDLAIPTGSATSSYNNSARAYTNPFITNSTIGRFVEEPLIVSGSFSGSALVAPVAGNIVSINISDTGNYFYEGNIARLTLSIANDLNTTTGTTAQTAMTTKVKNICVYTTTDVGATFSSNVLSRDLLTK